MSLKIITHLRMHKDFFIKHVIQHIVYIFVNDLRLVLIPIERPGDRQLGGDN